MSPKELSAIFFLYAAYCLETAGELRNPNRKAAIPSCGPRVGWRWLTQVKRTTAWSSASRFCRYKKAHEAYPRGKLALAHVSVE